MLRYNARRAVIIGGTSGMGLAAAKMLLNGGACVLATGRSQAAYVVSRGFGVPPGTRYVPSPCAAYEMSMDDPRAPGLRSLSRTALTLIRSAALACSVISQ